MSSERELTHEVTIQTLVDALEPFDHLPAFWKGGAIAFDRVDDWSDIDLYSIVNDKKVDDMSLAVERALTSLSSTKQKHGVFEPSLPDLFQAFYRVRDASEYLVIDVVVFKLSSPDNVRDRPEEN